MTKTDSTEGVRNTIARLKAVPALNGNKDPEPVKVLERHLANLKRQDREYDAMLRSLPRK